MTALPRRPQSARGAIEYAVDRGLLEGGGDIGIAVGIGLLGPHHRALEAGEGEMRLGAAQQGARQRHRPGLAPRGEALDRRAAGIAEAEDLGGLVEGFAQRIVDRRGEAAVAADAFDLQQLAMPARDEQQQVGIGERGVGQPRRQRVAFQVIDRDQRLAAGHRQRLAGHQTDHHPADQPRPGGGGDAVNVPQLHAGVRQSALN